MVRTGNGVLHEPGVRLLSEPGFAKGHRTSIFLYWIEGFRAAKKPSKYLFLLINIKRGWHQTIPGDEVYNTGKLKY